jgi:hypothetical protein
MIDAILRGMGGRCPAAASVVGRLTAARRAMIAIAGRVREVDCTFPTGNRDLLMWCGRNWSPRGITPRFGRRIAAMVAIAVAR